MSRKLNIERSLKVNIEHPRSLNAMSDDPYYVDDEIQMEDMKDLKELLLSLTSCFGTTGTTIAELLAERKNQVKLLTAALPKMEQLIFNHNLIPENIYVPFKVFK